MAHAKGQANLQQNDFYFIEGNTFQGFQEISISGLWGAITNKDN